MTDLKVCVVAMKSTSIKTSDYVLSETLKGVCSTSYIDHTQPVVTVTTANSNIPYNLSGIAYRNLILKMFSICLQTVMTCLVTTGCLSNLFTYRRT